MPEPPAWSSAGEDAYKPRVFEVPALVSDIHEAVHPAESLVSERFRSFPSRESTDESLVGRHAHHRNPGL